MNDFLEEYTISDQVVDKIVEFYKKNEDQAIQGQVDGGVDKNVKDSKDIVVPTTYEEEPFITYKNELHNCIELYGRKYELLKTIYSFGLIEPLVIQKYSKGGGFKIIYQNKTIKAVKGKTVIWPSDWTHSHKGQISHTKEKLIITGWYSHFWDF
jgi:hypothetical protein